MEFRVKMKVAIKRILGNENLLRQYGVFFVVVLLLFSILNFMNNLRDSEYDLAEMNLYNVAKSASTAINLHIESYITMLNVIATEIETNSSFTSEETMDFLGSIAKNESIDFLAICYPDGKAVTSDNIIIDATEVGYKSDLLNGETVITDVIPFIHGDGGMISIFVPLYKDGIPVASLCMSISTINIDKALKLTFYDGEGYYHLIDENGRYVAIDNSGNALHMDVTFFDAIDELEYEKGYSADDIRRTFETRVETYSRYSSGGNNRYAYLTHIGINEWVLMTIVPSEVILKNEAKNIKLAATLIIQILSLMLIVFLYSFMTQRRAKRTAELNNKCFSILAEQTSKVMLEWDYATSKLIPISDFSKIFGRSIATSSGASDALNSKMVHPDDKETFSKIFSEVITGKSVENCRFRIMNSEGEYLWCSLSAVVVKDAKGKPYKAIATLENVDQAMSDIKAELQEDTFELINNSFSGGILGANYDEFNSVNFVNDVLLFLMGYERDEFMDFFKDNTVKMIHEDDIVGIKAAIDFAVKNSEDFQGRVRLLRKGGSIMWAEINGRIRKTSDGEDTLLIIFTDISEIIELQMETEAQAHILDEHNEMMLSSLRYASRIQSNLLPPDVIFNKTCEEHYIFWSPKDIVGGDIYWTKRYDDGILLCVCDCTGHGTPGALLTMLVVSNLNSVASSENHMEPSKILWGLENMLSKGLNAEEAKEKDNINDGADLAILFIEKNGEVKISAATTKVFICDGENVETVKGQKLRIGEGAIKNRDDIQTTVISANPKNKFYIGTDGLFDQIGGENKIPFGYKQFKQIILENHSLDLSQTGGKIKDAFEAHKGEETRRDDVTFVAFKPNIS